MIGDWGNPYLTMSFDAEAQIARELMKVAASGQLYRGSKPVMWSVVERTALAEAEIEYSGLRERHDLGEVPDPLGQRRLRQRRSRTSFVLRVSSGPPRRGPSPPTAPSRYS